MKRYSASGKRVMICLLSLLLLLSLMPTAVLAGTGAPAAAEYVPQPITLTAPSKSKVYDGTPLVVTDGEWVFTNLPPQVHHYTVTTNPIVCTVTEPGTKTIKETDWPIWGYAFWADAEETKNLTQSGLLGHVFESFTLTVTKRQVTLTVDNLTMAAGGEVPALSARVTGGDGFLDGDGAYTLRVVGDTSQPGSTCTIEVVPTGRAFTYAEGDWGDRHYEIDMIPGTLTITDPEPDIVDPPEPDPEFYNVLWLNEGGALLEADENVASGAMPAYNGAVPAKAADTLYTYAFAGWTPAVQAATANASYTARYTATPLYAPTDPAPAPAPDPTPTVPPGGGPAVVPLSVTEPGPPADAEVLPPVEAPLAAEPAATPQAEPAAAPEGEALTEEEVPLAASAPSWALLNLLLALFTLMMGVPLAVFLFTRGRRRDETGRERALRLAAGAASGEGAREAARNRRSGIVWRVAGILLGALSPIVFLLTENIRNPMVMADPWTPLMVTIIVVQLVSMLLLKYARSQRDETGRAGA